LYTVFAAVGLGNKRPRSKTEWASWFRLHDALPFNVLEIANSHDLARFFAGCPEWSSPEWVELTARAYDLRDLQIESPIFFHKFNFRQCLGVSNQWHEERTRLQLELSKADEKDSLATDHSWEGLLAQKLTHLPTGIEFVELLMPQSLSDEASALQHCVDGYSRLCYAGESRIISLRKDGRSLATAEFRLKEWKDKPTAAHLYCSQVRGRRNDIVEVSSPAGQAFTWLRGQLRGRKIAISLIWPEVPIYLQPVRMRDRQRRLAEAMEVWMLSKYPGIKLT
jgi:hypothetical protein